MKYLTLVLAFASIALAIFTSAVTLYPFFQIGFSTLSEQYPNSKAYIISAALDETGIPLGFYIVGMDFTTKNVIIFDVPVNLSVNGRTLNIVYTKKGINGVKELLSSILKIKFTDYFSFEITKADKFLNILNQRNIQMKNGNSQYKTSEFEKTYKIDKAVADIGEEGALNMLSLYPTFKSMFNTSIDIAKFLRMVNFFKNNPKVSLTSYPTTNDGGILKTNKKELENLSIELQNCAPLSRPTSLFFVLINNSSLSSKAFSYSTWNKWVKRGFGIRIIPTVCSYILRGKNVVFEMKSENWREEEARKILKEIYPKRTFEFINLNNFKNLEYYYEVEEISALNRYYNIWKSDFVILIGD